MLLNRSGKLTNNFSALIILVIFCVGCNEQPDLSAQELNEMGLSFHENREYREAIQKFNMAIDLDPSNAEYYDNRGLTYLEAGQKEQALDDFDEAINLNSDFGSPIRHKAWVHHSESNFILARDYYRKALEYYPEDYITLNNLAWILIYRLDSNYDEAIGYARKAVELKPTEPGLQDTLALAYYKNGQYEKAVDHYTLAISLLEKSGDIPEDDYYFYRRRGDAYLKLGNSEAAKEDYTIFIDNAASDSDRRAVEEILKSID